MDTITVTTVLGNGMSNPHILVLNGRRRIGDDLSAEAIAHMLKGLRRARSARVRCGRGSAESLPPTRPMTAAERQRIEDEITWLDDQLVACKAGGGAS